MDYDDLSRRMGSGKRQKLQAWKTGSEAERIALYRRVWGPAWRCRSTDPVPDGTTSREELISRNLIVVETIAATLLRAGQNLFIEKDDLLQVGYAELIRTGQYTVETLAEKLGVKRSTIYNRLKLTKLSPEVSKAVAEGSIPPTIAELIGRAPQEIETDE
jgi:hypothetical protein